MTLDQEKTNLDGKDFRLDPRFKRPSKKATKVVVDKRFEGMFKDGDFVEPLKVDKYGREAKETRDKEDLKRFYRLEEGEQSEEVKYKSSSSEESPLDDEGSEASSDSEVDEESAFMDEALSAHPLVAKDVTFCDATRRLALVNMDWDQISAEDIYTIFYGFKPVTGDICSVVIYPSKFGRERMERELLEGPPKELFEKTEGQFDFEDEEENRKPIMNEEGEDYDENALRRYQLERLRYYYAVVECDSPETAFAIYKNCDGSEFEKSANFLDLRFIPDETTFSPEEDGIPKDACLELPKKYRPKPEMVTSALQKSKVSLTWDADDVERERVIKRPTKKAGKFDYEEADLRAYLASSSGEDEDGEHTINEQTLLEYRTLLNGSNDAGGVFGRKGARGNEQLRITFASALKADNIGVSSAEDNDGVDMEATFDMSQSEGSSEEGLRGEDLEYSELAPFHKYVERKKKKKEEKQIAKNDRTESSEKKRPSTKSERRKLSKEEQAELEQESARLSLLLDGGSKAAANDEDLEDSELARKRSRKGKKGKKAPSEDEFADVDINDPRFAAVYEEPSFALDPSSSAFKKTAGTKKIIEERQKRLKHKNNRS